MGTNRITPIIFIVAKIALTLVGKSGCPSDNSAGRRQ